MSFQSMKEEGEAPGGFKELELLPVTGEWTGYRAGVKKDAPELNISEAEKYTEMMKEVTAPTTVLYFHGGAYYLLDPATYRPTAKKLAKLTKSRVFDCHCRLAPQNPFPAALLDALVSYFSLLYPPPGAFHSAVEARHIIFAGDSAGANLSAVLLQALLEFRRRGLRVVWNGEARDVSLPVGVALCSPWADITASTPSCSTNGVRDYLPAMGDGVARREITPCGIWTADPPRNNLCAEDAVRIPFPIKHFLELENQI